LRTVDIPMSDEELDEMKADREADRIFEESKNAGQLIRTLTKLLERLDVAQKPLTDELELHLHRLPEIAFQSLEQKQDIEDLFGKLSDRLGKRFVRFDAERKVPADEPPSILRCNSFGKGYFRLEYNRDGEKYREQIGPNLPALSQVPLPADVRKRKN
jgi:hypothetical protein